jgi:hypothetical protein
VSPERRALFSGRLVFGYAAATVLSFPILEIVLFGTKARHFAHDVFDEGAVSRLGALRLDWSTFGPVLWNAHLTAGNAYFGQFNASPVALDGILALLTTPFIAYVTCLVLMAFLAGLSMHLFLEQSVGLPWAAALGGGLIYILGFRYYGFGFSAVLLPLVLWLSDRVEHWRGGRLRRVVPLALCAAFLLYNFSPQAAVITGLLHLAYCLVCADGPQERRSRVLTWAASWALGFALYGPVLLTLMRMLPDSQRSIRNDLAWIPDTGTALRLWLQFYAETLIGRPGVVGLGAKLREATDGTWYVGFLGIGILAFAAGTPRETRRERAIGWLLVLLPLVDLIALTFLPAQKHLGVLRSFQVTRSRMYVPFALAANVAVAMGVLLRPRRDRGHNGLRRSFSCGAALILFLAEGLLCGRSAVYVIRRIGLSALDPSVRERIRGWSAATLYFGLAILVALWFLWDSRRSRPDRGAEPHHGVLSASRVAVVALLMGLVLERLAYSRVEHWVEPRNLASFDEALGETPAIRYLIAQPNPESRRVLTLGDQSRPSWRDHPNRLMFWGLFCAGGYENVYPLRYHQLFGLLTKPHLDKDADRRRDFHSWGHRAYAFGPELNPALTSLMGIRWLYVRGAPILNSQWQLAFEDGDERVFQNAGVFPKGFLVFRLERFPTRQALLGALETASVEDLRSAAFVEGDDPAAIAPAPLGTPEGEVTLLSNTPDHVSFRVRTPNPALLILTDAYVPGWEASVNGSPRPIFAADNCFRGVAVPAGECEVTFSYRPSYTYAGAWAAAAAVLVLGMLVYRGRSLNGVRGA